MAQKVIQIGTSVGITLPKESLKEMGVKVGDKADISFDPKNRKYTITLREEVDSVIGDTKFIEITKELIEKHRNHLDALSGKKEEKATIRLMFDSKMGYQAQKMAKELGVPLDVIVSIYLEHFVQQNKD
ncbi:MAG: hypothetical protein COT88_00845 [Candidatus Colwellbacteria bacterium CG10_big_fil_rev_8_21_14_0_10_41_28]|uniref:SpoVT-AbrB domain-containing protein n=1 Tax=Candidatus Colwellbacteria bacterium CG10_big_fil_rev_8_21_14_0_10_41_28 TaxID=1974539 RepID=A0A2H0VHI0_9BACT|nr:MAG: hypothetical protein COT88_00845 [Candidatus Colwellbacteria bacterium CG10_big_fil_rev_8_21_14_0_10_41_28]